MNVKNVEKLEHSMVRVTIEIDADEFDAAVESVYRRMKNQLNVPGFRKGKAPRKLVEKMYGANLFYEDAVNEICPKAVEDAVDQENLEIVGYPEMHVESVGPEGVIVNADIAVRPEVTVENYKGIVAPYKDVEVTEHDVDVALTPYINRAKTTVEVDREAAKDDTVVIDFVGYKNGKEFKGGKAEGYELKLGSNSFIPGFEEQLIGTKAGDEKELHLTFPADYAQKELAGAPVVFKVKVNTVKTVQEPVLDDEFAKDVSEFDTLEALRDHLREECKKDQEERAQTEFEYRVLEKLVEQTEFDIPPAMVDYERDRMLNEYNSNFASSGMSLEQYISMTGATVQQFLDSLREDALLNIKKGLVLDAIAKQENVEVNDEDIDAYATKLGEGYGMSLTEIKSAVPTDNLEGGARVDKAARILYDAAIHGPAEEEKKEEAAEKTEDAAE